MSFVIYKKILLKIAFFLRDEEPRLRDIGRVFLIPDDFFLRSFLPLEVLFFVAFGFFKIDLTELVLHTEDPLDLLREHTEEPRERLLDLRLTAPPRLPATLKPLEARSGTPGTFMRERPDPAVYKPCPV